MSEGSKFCLIVSFVSINHGTYSEHETHTNDFYFHSDTLGHQQHPLFTDMSLNPILLSEDCRHSRCSYWCTPSLYCLGLTWNHKHMCVLNICAVTKLVHFLTTSSAILVFCHLLYERAWWRYDMGTLIPLPVPREGYLSITGGFPQKGTKCGDFFFLVGSLYKCLKTCKLAGGVIYHILRLWFVYVGLL